MCKTDYNNIISQQYGIKLKVWGDFACFSRPELKVERVSYDVMTPSAARGIIDSIYWHPGVQWIIDKIYVRAPVRTMSMTRNEVKSIANAKQAYSIMTKGKGGMYIATSQCRTQRSSIVLRDVMYVIEAHFDITKNAAPKDNSNKFIDITRTRILKGQCYSQPYLGCREFTAMFDWCEDIPPCPKTLKGTRDLGYMLWDMDYSSNPDNIQPIFFHAVMRDGVINVPSNQSELYR